MRQLIVMPAAERDFQDIARYIRRRERDERPAKRFVSRLRARCAALARLPGTLGRERADLEPGLRSFASGNYVIFFRYELGILRVIRIIEGHRDMTAQFGGG